MNQKAALIVTQTGQEFSLNQEIVTIGRKGGNTVVLEDDLKTSRHHASIVWAGNICRLQDMGSSNGTYLNDKRLTEPQPLRDGDQILIGTTTFLVRIPDADTEPSLSPPPVVDRDSTMMSVPSPVADSSVLSGTQHKIDENPYVGPRTFSQQESDRFFGREREARELLSLIISERLALFYAQSGAGKSSLIHARLVPQLREAELPVLPIGRVSGELPEGIETVENIFSFNLLLSLDESDGTPDRFTHMRLTTFLTRLTSIDGQHYYYDDSADLVVETEDGAYEPTPYVLIIDQFEEIFTTHQARWQDREDFFQQLDQAMNDDPMLWVVLSLREDYVTALDPYTHLLASKMRARFYMQRMSHEAALDAIKIPAERYGRAFETEVAENLVDNLRQIRVQADQASTAGNRQRTRSDIVNRRGAEAQVRPEASGVLGQFIEPVQLQVVCYQLWENLRERPDGEITQQNLDELGDVDEALAQFYEQILLQTVQETGVSEIELRNWFETQLITEAGTRGTVYRGLRRTGSISNRAVGLMASKFIVRSEVRTGGTWYELVHDRFIEPILQANQAWRLKQPLIQMAQTWSESDRSSSLLLEGQTLHEALDTNWQGLGRLVREFLGASQSAQRLREKALQDEKLAQAQALAEEQAKQVKLEAQATASLRRRNRAIIIMSGVAVIFAFVAGTFGVGWVQSLARTASAVESAATAEKQVTDISVDVAVNEQKADDAEATAQAQGTRAALSEATTQAEETVSAASQATTSAQETAAANNAATADLLGTRILELQVTAAALETAAALNADEANKILSAQESLLAVIAEATSVKATAVAGAAATADRTQATLSAEAAKPPSATQPLILSSDTSGPTNTPTATATATPDIPATQIALSEVYAAQTAEASQGCRFEPATEFRKAWLTYEKELGCSQLQSAVGGSFAEQTFEGGSMLWSAIIDVFIVIVDNDKRDWYRIEKDEIRVFNPSGPACDPPAKVPAGRYQPIRGFGGIWCERLDIQKELGWATQEERGVDNDLIQEFEGGIILRDSEKRIYVLFNSGTYRKSQ